MSCYMKYFDENLKSCMSSKKNLKMKMLLEIELPIWTKENSIPKNQKIFCNPVNCDTFFCS